MYSKGLSKASRTEHFVRQQKFGRTLKNCLEKDDFKKKCLAEALLMQES